MDISGTVKLGDSPSLGPIKVEMGQHLVRRIPQTTVPQPPSDILGELQSIHATLLAIHAHITRPPWWRRLLRRIKSWVA